MYSNMEIHQREREREKERLRSEKGRRKGKIEIC